MIYNSGSHSHVTPKYLQKCQLWGIWAGLGILEGTGEEMGVGGWFSSYSMGTSTEMGKNTICVYSNF